MRRMVTHRSLPNIACLVKGVVTARVVSSSVLAKLVTKSGTVNTPRHVGHGILAIADASMLMLGIARSRPSNGKDRGNVREMHSCLRSESYEHMSHGRVLPVWPFREVATCMQTTTSWCVCAIYTCTETFQHAMCLMAGEWMAQGRMHIQDIHSSRGTVSPTKQCRRRSPISAEHRSTSLAGTRP